MGIRYLTVLGFISILMSVQMLLMRPAWAETRQYEMTLDADGDQTFESLVQQAESLAINFIQQGFAESPSVTEVSVTISGERSGQFAPIVVVNVARADWQRLPVPQEWMRYVEVSASLLGLEFSGRRSPDRPRVRIQLPRLRRFESDPGYRDD